jgi:hypothetical protein
MKIQNLIWMLSFEYRFKNSSFHGAAEAESGLKSVREKPIINC